MLKIFQHVLRRCGERQSKRACGSASTAIVLYARDLWIESPRV